MVTVVFIGSNQHIHRHMHVYSLLMHNSAIFHEIAERVAQVMLLEMG
jgi:hypothetical protein